MATKKVIGRGDRLQDGSKEKIVKVSPMHLVVFIDEAKETGIPVKNLLEYCIMIGGDKLIAKRLRKNKRKI